MFDGMRDWIAVIVAVLLIVLGVLSYLGFVVPAVMWIAAVLFIVGGLVGISDVLFDTMIYGVGMKAVYVGLFLVVVLLGVQAIPVFSIPVIGSFIDPVAQTITHYIVNAVVAVALIAVAFQS